jgi:hypothetical protein
MEWIILYGVIGIIVIFAVDRVWAWQERRRLRESDAAIKAQAAELLEGEEP